MFEGLMAFFASLGFGILFNVPKKHLLSVALVGMLGGIMYRLLLVSTASESLALFVASMAISLVSEILARCLHCPTTIFLICAMVPLVPGGGMYYTMLDIVNADFVSALTTGMNTLINACSIVLGCTLVSSIFYAINHQRLWKR